MPLSLEAACACHIGKVRKNNEDNFFFDGRCLEQENVGLRHPVLLEKELHGEEMLAVFDGMGGERYGEVAAYAAASCMKDSRKRLADYFVPESTFLKELCSKMNEAVIREKKEYFDDRMGTTVAGLLFAHKRVYVFNLGDSRAYRLRDGVFAQISEDHTDALSVQSDRKPFLTQHLGIDPNEDFLIQPHIAKGYVQADDQYLICSDGLTDMLTNIEIAEILKNASSAEACVQSLIDAALENGGVDNITAIACRIQ